MSTEVVVAGRIDSALTHFAGLGLAGILENAGAERVTLHWSDEGEPRMNVRVPSWDDDDISSALATHASEMDTASSWIHARVDHEGRPGTGLFSPRIKPPTSSESWNDLVSARRGVIDRLTDAGDMLSLEFLSGLGEPASWRFDPRGEPRPDQGASRWEMKARNKGEEFVGNRLARMVSAVARRSPAQLLAGVRGDVSIDELDGKVSSQSATGLQRPGPVDLALAWTGLWGLTSFQVAPDAQRMSRTPAAFPQNHQWPTMMCLPVVSQPTTLERMRSLITSEALAEVGSTLCSPDEQAAGHLAAVRSLTELGAVACAAFRVDRRGSDNAPQRVVLDAELHLLTGEV